MIGATFPFGSLVRLASTTITAATSATFTGLTMTGYKAFYILVNLVGVNGGGNLTIAINTDETANHYYRGLINGSGGGNVTHSITNDNAAAFVPQTDGACVNMLLFVGKDGYARVQSSCVTGGNAAMQLFWYNVRKSDATLTDITAIKFGNSAGKTMTGDITIYGVK